MKLTVFHRTRATACCVEEQHRQHRMLCDGGTRREHARSTSWRARGCAGQAQARRRLRVAHRQRSHHRRARAARGRAAVEDSSFHKANGNSAPRRVPRPPEIARLWHNAFRDQIKDATPATSNSCWPRRRAAADRQPGQGCSIRPRRARGLATAVTEALKVSRRCQPTCWDPGQHTTRQSREPKLLCRHGQAAFNLGTSSSPSSVREPRSSSICARAGTTGCVKTRRR